MRPMISLAVICKNEEKNLQRLFDSVEGCFDEIVLVDTGSTDKSKEIAEKNGCKVFDFKWVNDFSAARNFAFSKITKEFVCWIDCDDVLKNKEGFIKWRDNAMEFCDMAYAAYNYAVDENRNPIVSFVRERVFRMSKNPQWQYPLHEGVIPQPGWAQDYAIPWAIDHLRDQADIAADKSRNIKILENLRDEKGLDSRLQFYYGKELYESGRASEAVTAFDQALKLELHPHDRILSFQYAAYAAMQAGDHLKDEMVEQKNAYYIKALEYCHKGIMEDPNRAEFHTTCGDIYLKKGDLIKAVPYYSAAKRCYNAKEAGSPYEGAIYSFVDCYGLNPMLNLAKIYFHLGRLDESKREASEAFEKFKATEAQEMLKELDRAKTLTNLDNNQVETEDIVFSCPPYNVYAFDEEIYKTKGMGGSETALIEMAKQLKLLTGRRVIIFNNREADLTAESGVEYISNKKLNEYFSKFRPKVHIAWRHNIRCTNAKTYLWCHDLVTMGVEGKKNFDKIFCLSPFHKDFVMAKQAVAEDMIVLTRNGLNPDKFNFPRPVKNPNKLVWMSSPDRGLEQCIQVCDEVRKEFPEVELHVYYGLENLYKDHRPDLPVMADRIKAQMAERPWIKYWGFTEQSKMYRDVADAAIWCHPCNFIETSCITALEQVALGIFPVTRKLGGLKDTLQEAEFKGHAILLDEKTDNPESILKYAKEVKAVLKDHRWENIEFDIEKHSWASIAKEWVREFGLDEPTLKEAYKKSLNGHHVEVHAA